jgi:CheY-like chemotaxis protein
MTFVRDLVLVVDDDPDLRDLIACVAETCGFRAHQAPDCRTAIEMLKSGADQVAIVFLDYYMPGMQPLACATEIRRLAAATPVVLLTAAVNAATRAAELGLAAHLGKPFDLEDLEAYLYKVRPPAAASGA